MATGKLPLRRQHTGTFAGDQIQLLGQQAAKRVNSVDTRVATLEAAQVKSLVLANSFVTTLATPQRTLLAFDVAASDLLQIEYWGLAGLTGDALGMKYQLGAPVGSVVSGTLSSSLTNSLDITYPLVSAVNTVFATVHTVNGGLRPDYLNVRLRVGSVGGNVSLMACSTTAGKTTTIAALASMRVTRLTEVR